MVILYTLIMLVLIIGGSVGLFVTYTGSEFGDTIWAQGTVTYGVFIIIAVMILIGLLTFLIEHD